MIICLYTNLEDSILENTKHMALGQVHGIHNIIIHNNKINHKYTIELNSYYSQECNSNKSPILIMSYFAYDGA